MAESLLAHLYSRIKGSQEDVATMSLQYLLSQSSAMNKAFTNLVSSTLKINILDDLQYSCQSVGDNLERPDMVGNNPLGEEILLCEMKFYAGLTNNQPLGYLERLSKSNGKGLVFICPEQRRTSLWNKLIELCVDQLIESYEDNYAVINGIPMSILTWDNVIKTLEKVVPNDYEADLKQLEGFCNHMDRTAFIPYKSEELSLENARKALRPYDVLDELVEIMKAEHKVKASSKSSGRTYYEQKLSIGECSFSLIYDINLWKSNNSVETPFWISSYDLDWDNDRDLKKRLLSIPENKKDDTVWIVPYFALEPLTDSPLDEVCQDLKRQVYVYLDLFLGNIH